MDTEGARLWGATVKKTEELSCLLFRQMNWKENNSKSHPLCGNPSSYPKFSAVIKLKKVWEQVGFYEVREKHWILSSNGYRAGVNDTCPVGIHGKYIVLCILDICHRMCAPVWCP